MVYTSYSSVENSTTHIQWLGVCTQWNTSTLNMNSIKGSKTYPKLIEWTHMGKSVYCTPQIYKCYFCHTTDLLQHPMPVKLVQYYDMYSTFSQCLSFNISCGMQHNTEYKQMENHTVCEQTEFRVQSYITMTSTNNT